VQAVGLDFGTTLLFTGLYNVYSGLATGVPMCVQPMKTIAAVAIASNGGVTLVQVMAAGIFVSSAVLFLGVTRLVDVLHRVVPRSIIRGLQLGVGLKLAGSGLKMALTLKPAAAAAAAATAASTSKAAAAASSAVAALRWRQPLGVDGLLLGVLGLAFLLVTTIARRGPEEPTDVDGPLRLPVWLRRRRRGRPSLGGSGASSSSGEGDWPCRAPSDEQEEQEDRTAATTTTTAPTTQPQTCRVPSALLVVLVGVALTLATSPAGTLSALRLGPSRPQLTVPSPQDMVAGITTAGGLAQLPLTTLNSVLAVTQLADALYGADRPHDRWRWKPSLVAASVGVMNLLGCFFGAMPSCHGSGGLAAQHLFGARTGAAPVLLGGLKIALALLFGSSLFGLLRRFPEPLLGALLALSGVELASAARREAGPRGFSLLALTAAAILALDDTALGFAVGYGGWLVVIAYEFAAERLGVAVARARVLVAKRRAAAREESAAEP
jgi:MFS superfamily sulfate permease-like transporter